MRKTSFFMPKIQIVKHEIYFEIIPGKKNDAKWIVLLHEGLGSIGQWKDFPQQLANKTGYNILLYDRPGYGKSSVVKERHALYIHEEAGIVLPKLLSALKITEPVYVFGHSDGATIALMFAALKPEHCDRVLAEAPHVIIEEITRKGVLGAIQLFGNEKFKNGLKKYHGDKTESMFWSWAGFWSSDEAKNWDMLNELKKIKSPVCFIQGDKDHFGSFRQGEIIRSSISGAYTELLLENCGHVPHFEYPEFVLEKCVSFFKP